MPTDKDARKRAVSEYKNRKPNRGVFVVRCTATSRAWVGASPNLDAAKNGLWFMLRAGSSRDAGLQGEWNTHGEAAFTFEIVDTLDEDIAPMRIADELKQKKSEWAERERAGTLLP